MKSVDVKIVSAPFFPHTGAIFFFEINSPTSENAMDTFVRADPYVTKGIVSDFKI